MAPPRYAKSLGECKADIKCCVSFCSNELPEGALCEQMEYKTLGQSVGSIHFSSFAC